MENKKPINDLLITDFIKFPICNQEHDTDLVIPIVVLSNKVDCDAFFCIDKISTTINRILQVCYL